MWIGIREGGIATNLFIDPIRWPLHLLLGVGAGFVGVVLWRAVAWLPLAKELEQELADRIGALPTSEALAMALLSGVGEELFFRGAMLPSIGLVLSSFIFAMVHTGPGRAFLLWTAFALAAGMALGGLFEWSGNLLAPAAAHIVINAVGLYRLSRMTPTDSST